MSIAASIKRCRREILGFSLFLAWEYCALFGCTLVSASPLHNSIEYAWMAAGIAEAFAAGALMLMAKTRYRPRFGPLCKITAAALIASTACLRIAFSGVAWETFWLFVCIGGAFGGIGSACGLLIWGTALEHRDEGDIELIAAVAFSLSFALYCAIIFLKNCTLNCVLLWAFALGSSAAALAISGVRKPATAIMLGKRPCRSLSSEQSSPDQEQPPAPSIKSLASVIALVAVLWFQVAYFRVLETPDYPSNRFLHYLIPFSISCLISLALIAIALRRSRYLNMSMMFRWQLPFLMISCAILYFAPFDQTVRSAAYTFDFLGMFGLQFGFWIGAAKQAKKMAKGAALLFACLAIGKGLGIAAGCAVSLWLSVNVPLDSTVSCSMLLCALTLMATMAIGFKPKWLMGKAMSRDIEEESGQADEPQRSLDSLFGVQADALRSEYGLTKRETEIAAMLLAGRSRPYIRDELVISLNTVHSHAKNIFAKCGVHSQQELMDLARSRLA